MESVIHMFKRLKCIIINIVFYFESSWLKEEVVFVNKENAGHWLVQGGGLRFAGSECGERESVLFVHKYTVNNWDLYFLNWFQCDIWWFPLIKVFKLMCLRYVTLCSTHLNIHLYNMSCS